MSRSPSTATGDARGRHPGRVNERSGLAASTLCRYAQVWDSHILPRLGDYALRTISPRVVQDLQGDLAQAGVGAPTIRKSMFVLQSVLGLAELYGYIPKNPAQAVKKPRQQSRVPRPLAPRTVERVRSSMSLRDATLVSLLAYAGLRPGEALALRWHSVRERTLLVEAAIAFGEEKDTKMGTTRTVRLLAPLAEDLAAWRRASAPAGDAYLFPRDDGGPWRDHDYRNWRDRLFSPPARQVQADARPYDLRHSFASLLIQEGVQVVEVARQIGNSPELCMKTYAHVFEELDTAERVAAEALVRSARTESQAADVRRLYGESVSVVTEEPDSGSGMGSRRGDSNPRPPLYESGALAS
jgi:integrase